MTTADKIDKIIDQHGLLRPVTQHPELQKNEIFLLNITPEEFDRFNSTLPKWAVKLRIGNVAYTTNSDTIVPEFVPLFAELKQD